ncbi:MAG: hypothetical protein KC646_04245 [Candidatus Cloacimonetes bacterium]|nr:hypothetical protein [Candidatus Cloacimonadota bacterium]
MNSVDDNLYTELIESPTNGLKAIMCRVTHTNQDFFGTCSIVPFENARLAEQHSRELCVRAHSISNIFDLGKDGVHLNIYGPEHLILDVKIVTDFCNYLEETWDFKMTLSMRNQPVLVSKNYLNTPVDLSQFSAEAIFRVIKKFQNRKGVYSSLMKVAIQGLGKVGMCLAKFCYDEGYQIYASDISNDRRKEAQALYGVIPVQADQIYMQDCTVFCPCAISGTLNASTMPQLVCQFIVGSAQFQKNPNNYKLIDTNQPIWAPDILMDPSILAYFFNKKEVYFRRLELLV